MIVTVQIPDHLATRFNLGETGQSYLLLEAFVLQRYAEGELTSRQVGEALGLSAAQTDLLLHCHHAPLPMSLEGAGEDLVDLEDKLGRLARQSAAAPRRSISWR